MNTIAGRIAKELSVDRHQVEAAIQLFGEGATVPFVARYRKEKTGGLDDTQLRKIEERVGYLRQLEANLATQPSSAFTPDLALLDSVFTSLTITDAEALLRAIP